MGLFNREKHPALRISSAKDMSLTAAGVKIDVDNAPEFRRLIQPWQNRALSYYDLVGECWFASQFYGRSLSQIRLFVGIKDEAGEVVEIEDQNEATALLDRIRDPGGTGRSHLQASYGRLMFITGEGLLVCTQPENEEERWEFLSTDEIRVASDDTYVRYRAPALGGKQLTGGDKESFVPLEGDGAVVYRLWRKHPRYSAWADSPMKGVLDLFEELLLLQLAVLSRVKSRLSAAGVLFIPDEITQPSQDSQKADENVVDDPLLAALVEAANAAITEPGTASAVVPIIVRAAGEWIDKIKHVTFLDGQDVYPETGLRMEVIKRIAMGLDLPPEILLGLGDSNHWTSWQIDEQTAKAHIFPICQQFVDDLTSAYLRPAAKEADIEGWEDLVIGYDPAALLVAPDRAKDALSLYNAGELSGDALREASGFDEDDAPSEEERWRYLGEKIRDAGLALYGIPTLRSGSGIEPEAGVIEEPPPPAELPAPSNGNGKGPPPAGMPSAIKASGVNEQTARVLGAAEFAFTRARALAGARLRTSSRGCEECEQLIAGIANTEVASVLGRERFPNWTSAQLVAGAASELMSTLEGWGVDVGLARTIGEQVERYAAQTLFETDSPSSLPDGFAHLVEVVPA